MVKFGEIVAAVLRRNTFARSPRSASGLKGRYDSPRTLLSSQNTNADASGASANSGRLTM